MKLPGFIPCISKQLKSPATVFFAVFARVPAKSDSGVSPSSLTPSRTFSSNRFRYNEVGDESFEPLTGWSPALVDARSIDNATKSSQKDAIAARPLFNPWEKMFLRTGKEKTKWYQASVFMKIGDIPGVSMRMILPHPIPTIDPIEVYWDQSTTCTIRIAPDGTIDVKGRHTNVLRRIRSLLMQTIYGEEIHISKNVLAFFVPKHILLHNLAGWLSSVRHSVPATLLFRDGMAIKPGEAGLVQRKGYTNPYVFVGLKGADQSDDDEGFENIVDANTKVLVAAFPKRRDFLHPPSYPHSGSGGGELRAILRLPISECQINRLPAGYSTFAAFIPTILRRLELGLIAEDLMSSLLLPVGIKNLQLIQTAITTKRANEKESGHRLEQMGSAILKLIATLQVAAASPTGTNSPELQRIVSNENVANKCIGANLDQYVVHDEFTGLESQASFLHSHINSGSEPLQIRRSRFTLAGVSLALIGASFSSEGLKGAQKVISVLGLSKTSTALDSSTKALFDFASKRPKKSYRLHPLESVVGHKFAKLSLLDEAITNSAPSVLQCRNWDRLEWIGDAVLHFTIVSKLFHGYPHLSGEHMGPLRDVLASTELLGFLCMNFKVPPTDTATKGTTSTTNKSPKGLWHFMQPKENSNLRKVLSNSLSRFETHRGEVWSALEDGSVFPWVPLARINSSKMLCDILESCLGAVFVDSRGNFAECEAFLERLGFLRVLHRLAKDGVDCVHPKMRLTLLTQPGVVEFKATQTGGDWNVVVRYEGQAVTEPVCSLNKFAAETEAAYLALEKVKPRERKSRLNVGALQVGAIVSSSPSRPLTDVLSKPLKWSEKTGRN